MKTIPLLPVDVSIKFFFSHLVSDNSILTKSKIMTHSTDDVIDWDDARFYDSFSVSWLVFQNCLYEIISESFFTICGLSIDKGTCIWNLTLKSLIVLMWYFLFICRAVDVTHFVHHNVVYPIRVTSRSESHLENKFLSYEFNL